MVQKPRDNGDQEGSRLSRARLGPAACILARKGAWKYFRLDRGAVLEAEIADGMHERLGKIEVVKSGFALNGGNLELSGVPVFCPDGGIAGSMGSFSGNGRFLLFSGWAAAGTFFLMGRR
jgi:hypothetical protein